jgi:predicted SAM-dependent methyltransferase
MQKDINYLDLDPNQSQPVKSNWQTKLKKIPFKVLVEDNPFTQGLYKVLPRKIFAPIMYELYIKVQTLGSRNLVKRYSQANDLLINLGAGERGKPGWVNVDVGPWPSLNCVWDCRNGLPFPDNSVKGIFCEHFLEHLDYKEEAPAFLAECKRVLKVGGVIRIIVPDAEKYLHAYCKEGWEELCQTRPLNSEHVDFHFGDKYTTKMEVVNAVFRQGFEHKFAYDYTTLELLLNKSGFSSVQRQDFGKSLMDELCIDLQFRASESLYVEAVKGSD